MNKHSKFIYRSGVLSVTTQMLRFRGRRYRLSKIENTILRRPLFIIATGFAMLFVAATIFNNDIIYLSETIILLTISIFIMLTTWFIGTLQIHSRTLSTSEGAITWLYKDLAKAQEAIEELSMANEDNDDDL
ncbi:MAG: hypothetical protein HRU28_13915 [Rhizobiales bacterium]|nr:hypothetical protein [Hyphomicrobiales bacterium]